ncbi:MAG: ATP synthase complex assembly protein atp12 [Trizodia sp. TS-e1964]|nr:MAG: ATP synthase complex assembly protein atp12 [Trizodia sp. TS-e1964]
MKLPASRQLCFRSSRRLGPSLLQRLHTSPQLPATALPPTQPGPPPPAPLPTPSPNSERLSRRRRNAALLQRGQEFRLEASSPRPQGTGAGTKSTLKTRFWKDVHVVEVEGGYQVHLDTRPVRTPGKAPLLLPRSKPHLATAIALEWENLTEGLQALQPHLVQLTALTSRALDIAAEDRAPSPSPTRAAIIEACLAYLETDTLLCYEPAPAEPTADSLRARQLASAAPVIEYVNARLWPGQQVRYFEPGSALLERANALVPPRQDATTLDAVRAWLAALSAWDLVGVERATLAGKSFLAAARLVAEWSAGVGGYGEVSEDAEPWGVESAVRAVTEELRWQTRTWGEVEDSHDVHYADLRQQFGSVVVLVSGE